MIVTIDGPAGAGKSTAARALAQRLGFDFLDTGAMYRAVTLAAVRTNTSADDEQALAALVDSLRIEMLGDKVLLNGEDVSQAIRTVEITTRSRVLADSPTVRRYLGRLQRQLGTGRNLVTEGRDQGTVIFPDAECKFFLTARPEARARRRYEEMLAQGRQTAFDDVLQAQTERDARDATRSLAPMVPAVDAIIIDSSDLKSEEGVDLLERHVRARMANDS